MLNGAKKWVNVLLWTAWGSVPRIGLYMDGRRCHPLPQGVSHNEPQEVCCRYTLEVNSKGMFQGEEGGAGRERSVPSRHKAEIATMQAIQCAIQLGKPVSPKGPMGPQRLVWALTALSTEMHPCAHLRCFLELTENDGWIDLFIGPFIYFAQSDGWI